MYMNNEGVRQPDWDRYLALRKDSPFTKEEIIKQTSQVLTRLEGSEQDVILPWEKVKEMLISLDPEAEIYHAVLTTRKVYHETFIKTDFNLCCLSSGSTRKVYVVGQKNNEGEWTGRHGRKFKYLINVIDAVTSEIPTHRYSMEMMENEWNTMFSLGCKDLC